MVRIRAPTLPPALQSLYSYCGCGVEHLLLDRLSSSLSTTLRSTPRVQTATPRVGKTARGLATRAPLGGPRRSALPCPAWLGAGPTFVAELLKDSMREHPLAAPLNGPLAVSKPRF